MSGGALRPARGDAVIRRHIAQWRRITARLQVLMNTGAGSQALADEAGSMARQCDRLADDLTRLRDTRRAGHRGDG